MPCLAFAFALAGRAVLVRLANTPALLGRPRPGKSLDFPRPPSSVPWPTHPSACWQETKQKENFSEYRKYIGSSNCPIYVIRTLLIPTHRSWHLHALLSPPDRSTD
ncbi:hypothetical protein BDZ91DRAFT_109269 [Kalaharituber pfeilii]|nr:hypothetical protein BDZ91DRAFT_109269 [Kalaharituber pfeilii]